MVPRVSTASAFGALPVSGAEDGTLDGPLPEGALGKENLCLDLVLQRTA
jgi:hypothetical protein